MRVTIAFEVDTRVEWSEDRWARASEWAFAVIEAAHAVKLDNVAPIVVVADLSFQPGEVVG